MSCSCKHSQQAINEGKKNFAELRELFIKRMTIDSDHNDRRRQDFNRAIFGYREDGSTYTVWSETDMDMVLQCFDDAIRDWRKSWCDIEDCKRR